MEPNPDQDLSGIHLNACALLSIDYVHREQQTEISKGRF